MLNLDGIANKNNKDHNKKWRYIPYRPCRIWIIGGSGLGKTNALLSLMIQQDDFDKICLYTKYLSEPNISFQLENVEMQEIKHLNDLKAFI